MAGTEEKGIESFPLSETPQKMLESLTAANTEIAQLKAELKEMKLSAAETRFENFCPYDAKYYEKLISLVPYLSMAAEVRGFVRVQAALMQGLYKFSRASQQNVDEMYAAIDNVSPALVYALEDKVTRHDQQAVIMAIQGRDTEKARKARILEILVEQMKQHVSPDTASKIHPGTTSYDIVDTARAWLYKNAIENVILPQAIDCLKAYVNLTSDHADTSQVGRTHGQWTSPTTFGYVMATYADALDDRIDELKRTASRLQGKVSGIVGTHASIGLFVGNDNVIEFERYVLEDVLGLQVPRASSQITRRERLADLGNAVLTMDTVLADSANSLRHLARSDIAEVAEGKSVRQRGGSSTDAGKANPITWENVNGLWKAMICGQPMLYQMGVSDHQRDLTNSVMARFEPTHMMLGLCLSLLNMADTLNELVVFNDRMQQTIDESAIYGTAECLNNVLKAHGFPDAHEAVRKLSVDVRAYNRKAEVESNPQKTLLECALENTAIKQLWDKEITQAEQGYLTYLSTFVGVAKENTIRVVKELREKYSFE